MTGGWQLHQYINKLHFIRRIGGTADTPDLGSGERELVRVQIPCSAPRTFTGFCKFTLPSIFFIKVGVPNIKAL